MDGLLSHLGAPGGRDDVQRRGRRVVAAGVHPSDACVIGLDRGSRDEVRHQQGVGSDGRGKGTTGARKSRWIEYPCRLLACMDYMGTVYGVYSAGFLAASPMPLPPDRKSVV